MANPTPQELQDQFDKLQRLATALGKNFSSLNLSPLARDAALVEELLGKWEDELDRAASSIGDISTGFQSFVQSISGGNVALNKTKGVFNNLTKAAQELEYHQQGITKLDEKSLEKLKEKVKKAQSDAGMAKSLAEQRKQELIAENQLQGTSLEQKRKNRAEIGKLNEAIGEADSILTGQNAHYQDLVRILDEATDEQKELNELMGLGGAAVEGTKAALDKLGLGKLTDRLGLGEVKSKMEETAKTIRDSGGNVNSMSNKFKVLKSGVGEAGKQLLNSFKDPLTLTVMLVKEMIDALKKMDGIAGDMAKKMNMTYTEALSLQNELSAAANSSGDLNVTTEALGKSLLAVNQSLGSNAKLNKEDLVTMTKLTEAAGFQHDELMGIEKLSLAQGKSLEDNTKEALGAAEAYASQKGLLLNEKEILKEVNKASASLKLSLGGSTSALAKAVVEAKSFGLTLEQAGKISEGLLNFEDSISNELNAELLTGKELNFEEARRLALNNDIAGAAAEVAKQVGTSKDFAKMNAIQQEAIAKAAGLTKEELAQSLIEREALQKLSGVEGENAKERFNNLVKEVGLEEAKKRLGDEQLASQFQQQSAQERLTKLFDKQRDMLMSLATPVLELLDPFVELITDVLPVVNALLEPVFKIIRLIVFLLKPVGIIIKGIGEYIRTFFLEPMQAVEDMLGGIIDIFKGDFEKGFKKLAGGIIRLIMSPFQAIVNGAFAIFNGLIDMANKIPGVSFEKSTPPNLSELLGGAIGLAEGGIVTKPTTALIGEGGEPEAVIPLSKMDEIQRNKYFGEKKSGLQNLKETVLGKSDTTLLLEKLDVLIGAVQQGGTVQLDGTKVGTAMSVSTYKIQ